MTAVPQPGPQLSPAVRALRRHLSPPRLAPYLAATGGHHIRALKLYHWNVELSGAVYEVLHAYEVILRNAMDEQLCAWNAQQSKQGGGQHTRDWLLDSAPLLQRLSGSDVVKATAFAGSTVRRTRGSRQRPLHCDVLAQLSMGTWRYLLPDTANSDPGKLLLWTQALSMAFPHRTRTRDQLVNSVARLHRLRNRIAHLEPLLAAAPLRVALADVDLVLGEISPYAQQWVSGWQRTTAVITRRP